MKLEGKVALITGAGSGIGEGCALVFAKEGADIAVNDIDLAAAEKTAAAVRNLGRRAVALKADVANAAEVEAMVDRAIKELGGIHILINNAGSTLGGPILEEKLEDWDRMINIVLRGTYLCTRFAGRWMVANKTGKIVNISSIQGLLGSARMSSYVSAKAGVMALTRSTAAEWAQYGINVNCIAPGIVDTPMTQRTIAKFMTPERLAAHVPLNRMGKPEDMAKTALFLCSDDASFITGVTIPVDGGTINAGGH
ncbi:MAG: SDR family oxidoreductase [Dehalococcoidales bacterium]|nr:SDR family oxidoreductase [Dehalococcoidales bacterium]